MAVVKGSKHESLVVVSYDPVAKRKKTFWFVMLFLVALGASYFWGHYDSLRRLADLQSELSDTTQQLADARQEIQNYNQRISLLEKGGEVDRAASETIRGTVKDLKQQITVLEEEVAFYKGIMAPSGQDKGLRIDKVDIQPSAEEGRINYSLMVTQVVDNRSSISGVVVVNIVGIADGQEKTLSLKDVDAAVQDKSVKFRFRYFQEIAGTLEFPVGFEPTKIIVVAQSSGKKAQRVEKTIPWPLKA